MSKYTVFNPEQEVIGAMILSYKNAIGSEDFHELYAALGMDQVQPDQWYPYQNMLDVFNLLEERGGAMLNFVSIGMAVATNVPLPPEFEALPFVQIMTKMPDMVASTVRGPNTGYTRCTQLGERHLRYEVRDCSPDDLIYGAIFGWARRFQPKGHYCTLSYDPDLPRREQGAEHTILHLNW